MSRAAYQRDLRERSFAQGLCYMCCSRPTRPGKKTCGFCHRRAVERRNAAADRGLCREQCGRPWVAPFRRCEPCRDRRRIWARDSRAAAKSSARRRPAPRRFAVPNRIALIRARLVARRA